MNPVDRACLYTFIFILGVFAGAVLSAIREGIEQAVCRFVLQKKVMNAIASGEVDVEKIKKGVMIAVPSSEDKQEEDK